MDACAFFLGHGTDIFANPSLCRLPFIPRGAVNGALRHMQSGEEWFIIRTDSGKRISALGGHTALALQNEPKRK